MDHFGNAQISPFEPEGRSDAVRRLRVTARTLSRNRFPVLITGEMGTGKLRFARLLHALSERPQIPLCRFNCAEDSTRFAEAWSEVPRGAIFVLQHLDEASHNLQKVLSRMLLMGGATLNNVRLIATTSRDLAVEVLENRFQSDLYFRLRVHSVELPALRERPEDICILARQLLEEIATQRGTEAPELTSEALDLATSYHWPGNILQLRNELIRCATKMVRTIGRAVLQEGLDVRLPPNPTRKDQHGLCLRDRVDAFEKQVIDEALSRTYGNRDRAAVLLGITRRTLQRKLVYHKRESASASVSGEYSAEVEETLQNLATETGAGDEDRMVALRVAEDAVREGEE